MVFSFDDKRWPDLTVRYRTLLAALARLACALAFVATASSAGSVQLSSEAAEAIDKMYGVDPDGGIALLHTYDATRPSDPLPYTIEAEARWWKINCDADAIKLGMVDSQKRGKKSEDDSYFALADHVIALAQAAIAQHDTSENHLYAGIGYALKTRLYGLRSEYRNAAKNGVASRTEFLSALELDPSNADASVGVGFYNYYVATLSPIVKVLSIFLGIPPGNKEEGIKQVQVGAEHGVLLATDARFYQARNFRTLFCLLCSRSHSRANVSRFNSRQKVGPPVTRSGLQNSEYNAQMILGGTVRANTEQFTGGGLDQLPRIPFIRPYPRVPATDRKTRAMQQQIFEGVVWLREIA